MKQEQKTEKKGNKNNFKSFFLLLFAVILCMGFVNAIDYDNITFTNEEFYNGAVTQTKSIELSNGKLMTGYIASNVFYLRSCDLDGTNCQTPVSVGASNNFDMFEDATNNRLIYIKAKV